MIMKKEDKNEGRDERGRFVRGNLFSVNLSNSGRDPKYTSEKELTEKLAEYLDYEDYLKKQGQGKGIYTIEGAALYLGFCSRQSIYDYEKNSEFSYIVKRFKLFLTHWNAQKLYWGGTMPGAKFWLTNHGGYTEETHQTITNNNVTASFGSTIDLKNKNDL